MSKYSILLPADFLEYFVEILEGLVTKLGAGDGLDHLVHAGVVAAPVVCALVPLAGEVRLVTRHGAASNHPTNDDFSKTKTKTTLQNRHHFVSLFCALFISLSLL